MDISQRYVNINFKNGGFSLPQFIYSSTLIYTHPQQYSYLAQLQKVSLNKLELNITKSIKYCFSSVLSSFTYFVYFILFCSFKICLLHMLVKSCMKKANSSVNLVS